MLFIGVDLAWTEGNVSGFARLEGDCRGVRLVETPQCLVGVAAVSSAVLASGSAVVAIDAPLVVTNQTGQRPCDHQISVRFARHHAGAHSSNLSLHGDSPCLALERCLSASGFRHFLDGGDRLMLEVYPHPATVVLFDRSSIFRYKKGKLSARRAGLCEYRSALERLEDSNPPLLPNQPLTELLRQPLADFSGAQLKAYEDQVDALFCGYLAAYAWCWRDQRIEFVGHRDTGCIMVPTHTFQGFEWHAAQQSGPAVVPSQPAVIMAQGREFSARRASDVVRDGIGLELLELPSREVVAEVFFHDPSGLFSISLFSRELPLEAVDQLIARAKRSLLPVKTNRP